MKKTIAIIGNGKVAKTLTLAFLKSGITMESIIVIGRNEEKLLYFKNKGIDTSIDIQDADGIPNLILAITPSGVGPSMKRLKELNFHKSQKLVCICSGIDITFCADFLGVDTARIVSATINTNIEYNKGIICLAESENPSKLELQILSETKKLFEPLGDVIFETAFGVLKSVASVGAMNAFDTKLIGLIAKDKNDIKNWLDGFDVSKDDSGQLIGQYLKNKSAVLVTEMGYTESEATKRSLETLESTVAALSCLPTITLADIDTHMKKVVTQGGCTEKGINRLETLEMFLSCNDLSLALRPVYERTLEFRNDVMQSFEEKR